MPNFTEYSFTLSIDTVLFIHQRMIFEEGGLPGVHIHKLQGALSRIDAAVIYENVTDLYELAALHGIVIAQGHPFNDGNKRTAMTCMLTFLWLNEIICAPPNNLIPDFVVDIAEKKLDLNQIAKWLRKYSRER